MWLWIMRLAAAGNLLAAGFFASRMLAMENPSLYHAAGFTVLLAAGLAQTVVAAKMARESSLDQFLKIIGDTPIRFGLVAQNKLEIVRMRRAEGKDWDEIGREIGWDGPTVKEHYERLS